MDFSTLQTEQYLSLSDVDYAALILREHAALVTTNTMNASESIVDGKRRLNVSLTTDAFTTNNRLLIGGHGFRYYAINSLYWTLPVYVDNSPTEFDTDSVFINGKVFDISKSGALGAYCLTVNDTNGETTPVRYVNFDGILLPVNINGDVIMFYQPGGVITGESVISWLSRSIRIVLIDNEWRIVINL